MVGRPVQLVVDKLPAQPADPVLEVENLRVVEESGVVLVDDVSFTVRGGEIYAIAGVQGNGQTELTRSLVGLEQPTGGAIRIGSRPIEGMSTDDILGLGVGYVPEDRLHDGLVGVFSVAQNLVLDRYDDAPFARGGALDLGEIERNADQQVQTFDIRPANPRAAAGTLSGGNQQKVVLARELSRPLRVLIVAQPTRGLDVGSMEFVHRRIVEERDRGAAVVLVSTELDEVLGLADRIAVMFQGRIAGEVPAGTSADEIGLLMAGHTEDERPGPAPVSAGGPR
jgi:simple sugar transport system ATP-binding protein